MNMLLTFFFTVTCLTSMGQTHISGKVLDGKNHPLAGISIAIKGSYDGTTSDSAGSFNFNTEEKGEQFLTCSSTGFRSFEQKVNLDGQHLTVNITMKEMVTELKAVTISAGSFEASDQKKTTVLNSIDIVTTASANADITAAIKTLPGTQQVGETEGLFVRGGTATESKTFIDGTLVNNFYYSSEPGLAQRGRFNPFIFKGTIFSAGGYSALYGQALSSALILESLDLPEKSSGQLSISYLSLGGGIQHLAKNKRSSWGVTYNYLDLGLAYHLIKQKPDYFKVPLGHQADGNFRVRTSKTGMLKYYGIVSSTMVGFRYADIDSTGMKDAFALSNVNMYHNLSWREKLGEGLKMTAGFSYSTNKDDIKGEFQDAGNQKQNIADSNIYAFKNFSLNTHGHYLNGKIVIEKKLSGLSALRVGSEYNYSNDKNNFTLYNGEIRTDFVKEKLLSGFGEADIYITNDVAAKIGTRAEHSSLLKKWNLAPRLSLAYKLSDNGQLSFAYGIFYQDPEKKYLPARESLNFAKATHYILQYQKLSNNRTFRTEVFYKKYAELFKTSVINGRESAVNNNGYGDARGIEFFWRDKRTVKNVDYWISYSYLDTKRDFLNYPSSIVPPFASKHTASLVVKKFVTKLKTQFNGSYTWATGRPYYDIRYDKVEEAYKSFDAGQTKDFNSLSFSVNYLPNIGNSNAGKFTVFVFSLTNVLGNNNIYTYNYSYDGKNKQPVLPPARRFFYLGCFISFGIDRSQDAINNNL
ncbi:MAG: TonB-dependent receptor [Ginsengibacter sp.]